MTKNQNYTTESQQQESDVQTYTEDYITSRSPHQVQRTADEMIEEDIGLDRTVPFDDNRPTN